MMSVKILRARVALAALITVLAIGGLSWAWAQTEDPFGEPAPDLDSEAVEIEPPAPDDRDPFDDTDSFGGKKPDPVKDPQPAAAEPDPFGEGNVELPGIEFDPFSGKPLTPKPAPRHIELPARKHPVSDERVRAALAEDTSLEFIETPLQDVIEYLMDLHKINIEVDQKSLEEVGLDREMPVTRNLKNVSLRSALRLVLRESDLTFMVRGGVLIITTPETAESEMITRVYPIAGLVREQDALADADRKADAGELLQVITGFVQPATWEEVGGPGSAVVLRDTLIVSNNEQVQDEVAALLKLLKLAQAAHGKRGLTPPETASFPAYEGRAAEIAQALARPAACDFAETPLSDVADQLEEMCKISIELDYRALEEVGIGHDTPVTLHIRDVSLGAALKLMLRPMDMTFVIRDEVLLITTPEEAETELVTRIYPVADLVRGRNAEDSLIDGEEDAPDFEPLMDVITSIVTPTFWEEVGGPGAIDAFPSGECLVVSQLETGHEEIASLLTGLRKLQADERAKPGTPASEALAVADFFEPVRPKLRASLKKEVGMMTFAERPLTEVVDILAEKHGVPIRIDRKALEEVGIDPQGQLISARLDGEPLAEALRRMLEPYDLTWMLKHEVIMITTPEEEESELTTLIYPVGDLVGRRETVAEGDGGSSVADELSEAIERSVRPTTWESVGGPGAIELSLLPFAAALVVSQTEEAHQEIADMLAQVRRVRQEQAKDAPPEAEEGVDDGAAAPPLPEGLRAEAISSEFVNKKGEKLYLKVYRLSSHEREDARELAETIRELIEPGHWTAEENYYLRALSGALIVRHTAPTHRKIHKLLTELDALPWPTAKTPADGSGLQGALQGGVFSLGER
jgi:hypothetical protein